MGPSAPHGARHPTEAKAPWLPVPSFASWRAALRLRAVETCRSRHARFDLGQAVDHIKGVVVRMSAVAALAVAAAIFALLAFLTWLVALYTRLEPAYGAFQALSIVGGVLAVIALVLSSAAIIVGRARTTSRRH
jgi:hypothetical protein